MPRGSLSFGRTRRAGHAVVAREHVPDSWSLHAAWIDGSPPREFGSDIQRVAKPETARRATLSHGAVHLTLIRHAESTWNATGRWQGQSDVPLSPRGRLQARALAARLYGAPFDHGYTSDLSRAVETAAAVGVPMRHEPAFREIDVGAWAGLTRKQASEQFADEVAALQRGEFVRIGGGESMTGFEARVDEAVNALWHRHPGERVLLVTHGGVVRALVTGILCARQKVNPLVGVGNTSISVVREAGGRLALERYNDGQHLDPADQDSGIVRAYEPSARMAVVASAPGAPTSRELVDAILGGLGIAQYHAAADVMETELAVELLSEPMPDRGVRRLYEDNPDGSFAVVIHPEAVPAVVADALSLELDGGRGLAPPGHGTVTQLRLFPERGELYSYGVPPVDP